MQRKKSQEEHFNVPRAPPMAPVTDTESQNLDIGMQMPVIKKKKPYYKICKKLQSGKMLLYRKQAWQLV